MGECRHDRAREDKSREIDILQLSPHCEDEKNAEVQDEDGPVNGYVHHGEKGENEGDDRSSGG